VFYVVVYDIVSDKVRNKVLKILQRYGYRVQYSVVECELNKASLLRVSKEIKKVIDKKTDKVFFYPLDEKNRKNILFLGKHSFSKNCIIL